MEVRQIHPLFVGEVSGIDLAQPVDAPTVRALWEAIDRYAALVFHDQRLRDWDNRCTIYRGRPHDDSHPRDLRRATTLDVGSTLDEAA